MLAPAMAFRTRILTVASAYRRLDYGELVCAVAISWFRYAIELVVTSTSMYKCVVSKP